MSSEQSVTCSRCGQTGLGWSTSRRTGKHYLTYLTIRKSVRTVNGQDLIVEEMAPNPGLLHVCGQTLADAVKASADWQANRARERALKSAPAQTSPVAATAVKTKTGAKGQPVKSTAAQGAVSVSTKAGQSVKVQSMPVAMATAAKPGPLEATVLASAPIVAAIVKTGVPEPIARELVGRMSAAEIAGMLLKVIS